MQKYVIKGNICYSKSSTELCIVENGYVVCENGLCAGVYEKLPKHYEALLQYDYTDQLVIPGLVDLHVHAPQYPFRGLGMDLELIDWLNTHAFPEEANYADDAYADRAYDIFVDDLYHSATTRACIFATIHTKATSMLMEKLECTGIQAFVGKVNMDRSCPENLCEQSAEQAFRETEQWIINTNGYENVKPILTPRFIPSCSDALMEHLSVLQQKYHLPVQSHLSENQKEIQWVKELCPDSAFYGDAYDKYHMFGGDCKTIMAHCVYSSKDEITRMKERQVFIAHCPESNTNLSSGIAPVRTYLDQGLHIGLGSDMAAGSSLSIFRAMTMAVQCSKLRWRLMEPSLAPLRFEEAFYLATRGGGAFWGNAGSFEKGFSFDAVVLDDTAIRHPQKLSVRERLECLSYLAEDRHIRAKFAAGRKLFDRTL